MMTATPLQETDSAVAFSHSGAIAAPRFREERDENS
jgi:hypothetical protein